MTVEKKDPTPHEKERRRIGILGNKLNDWLSHTPIMQEVISKIETSENYGENGPWIEVKIYGLIKDPPAEVVTVFEKRVKKYMRKLEISCEAKIKFEKTRGRKPKKKVIKRLPALMTKNHDLP